MIVALYFFSLKGRMRGRVSVVGYAETYLEHVRQKLVNGLRQKKHLFLKNSFIVDVWHCRKYTSVNCSVLGRGISIKLDFQ